MMTKIKSVKKVLNTSERYDLQIRNTHNFFADGILVHNSLFCIGYIPNLSHNDLYNNNLYCSSKGQNAKGLVFKHIKNKKLNIKLFNKYNFTRKWQYYFNTSKLGQFIMKKFKEPANVKNLYMNTFRKLIANGLDQKIYELSKNNLDAKIHLFGEIYGSGVQDLTYGIKATDVKFFAVSINGKFVPWENNQLPDMLTQLGLTPVPVLYDGPFILSELEKHRDGKTTLGGNNIREGLVIVSKSESIHPEYNKRKIAKMISPNYLTRKNENATEYN